MHHIQILDTVMSGLLTAPHHIVILPTVPVSVVYVITDVYNMDVCVRVVHMVVTLVNHVHNSYVYGDII